MSVPRIDPYCAVRTDEPLEQFLAPSAFIESDAPEIRAFVGDRLAGCDDVDAARRVFHFVRDEVSHSWDIQGRRVTRTALDVLAYREGICYAKSWIRFDARGNKPGVDAQFSLDSEQLAFKIRPEYDEVDYLVNHAQPHPGIIETLVQNDDAMVMYAKRLPSRLD